MKRVGLMLALIVLCGQTRYDSQCNMKLPSEYEIKTMPTASLYKFYSLALKFSDVRANMTVTGQPVPACINAIADRTVQYEHELKLR